MTNQELSQKLSSLKEVLRKAMIEVEDRQRWVKEREIEVEALENLIREIEIKLEKNAIQ